MAIEIGSEPALSLDAAAGETPPHRWAFSLRWLACTLLAGVAGGSLIGGALITAFDGEYEFARPAALPDGPIEDEGALIASGNSGKQDKIVTVARNFATKQIIHENYVRNVNGKDLITVKPYVRITTSLDLTTSAYADQIPTFNPIKLFSEAAAATKAEPSTDDKFVRIAVSDFYAEGPYDDDTQMSIKEVTEAVRDLAAFAPTEIAYAAGTGDEILAGDDAAFEGFSNATVGSGDGLTGFTPLTSDVEDQKSGDLQLVKRNPDASAQDGKAVSIEMGPGDTLTDLLTQHGCSEGEVASALRMLNNRMRTQALAEGTTVDLIIAADADGRERPVRVAIADQAAVILSSAGDFIFDDGNFNPLLLRANASNAPTGPRPRLFASIYATALRQGLPRDMVDDVVRILSFDVDYQRKVQSGDTLEVFYSEPAEGETDDGAEILYAAVTIRGNTHRFYRFRTPDDGFIDYYDPTGHSAKKFLMRKPMNGGRFRSPFGMRVHPILKYRRMHNGVDWAAPTGTPIVASGNGTIAKAEWKSGYGKYVEIRHANGYATGYAHMSAFAKGTRAGARVRQGQVIGYVGSTGLSTGPHLHYEVRVNGRLVDPMRIRLPRGRVLNGRMLNSFERERERIDALMNRAPASTRIAGLSR